MEITNFILSTKGVALYYKPDVMEISDTTSYHGRLTDSTMLLWK